MTLSTMFSNLLAWIVQFLLFVPLQLLKLVSYLMPPCAQFAPTAFAAGVSTAAVNWIRFLWPVIQYVPWVFVWNYLSAVILFFFFKMLWDNLPKLFGLIMNFWWIIVVFYVLGGIISIFTSNSWMSSNAFGQVFGTSPTSTGSTAGGLGGGGGGSW